MTFDDAFAAVVGIEGHDTNDPNDPGGYTRFGIAQASHPGVDVPNLTIDQAKAIYQAGYWAPAGCNFAPDPLKGPLFAAAVNQGVGTAVRIIQHALGVDVDGVMGPQTCAALSNADPHDITARFTAKQIVNYTQDAGWPHYGEGWAYRVALILSKS